MELNELIESMLRSQYLEEMQNRPKEEYSPTKGMSSEQVERYASSIRNFRQGPTVEKDERQTERRMQTSKPVSSGDIQIYRQRNDDATTEIVESIRTKLYEFLANGNEVNSDLMQRPSII